MKMEWLWVALGSLATIGVGAAVARLTAFLGLGKGTRVAHQQEATVADLGATEAAVQAANAARRGALDERSRRRLQELNEALDGPSPEEALADILNEGG
jgi:hypothetical protein